MKKNVVRVYRLVMVSMAAMLFGCGGSDVKNILGTNTEVRDISFKNDQLHVGDSTIASVRFRYDGFEIVTGDNLFVSILLPFGTTFRPDTAEIQSTFDRDKRVTPTIITCGASRETYLFFDIDRGDLQNAVGSDGSDATLTLTVDATTPVGTVIVAARAAKKRSEPQCSDGFEAQETASLIISR